MRYHLVVALLILLALACAKRGFPPGGPEDRTPPYVTEVFPQSGSTRVSRSSKLSVTFSESMKKRTVETGIIVNPALSWRKRYWKKHTYYLVPRDSLLVNTTYLITVSPLATDSHGLKMEGPFVWGFSTGSTIDEGSISGQITWKGFARKYAVVAVYDSSHLPNPLDFISVEPQYLTLTATTGKYEVPFVDTTRTYRVVAFLDSDLDGEYDEGEIVGCYHRTVRFTTRHLRDVSFTLCTEELGGTVEGRVDTMVFDLDGAGILMTALEDTTQEFSGFVEPDGSFIFRCVRPGHYRLGLYRDTNSNRKIDATDSLITTLREPVEVIPCHKCTVLIGDKHED